jgi:hypothetical protein
VQEDVRPRVIAGPAVGHAPSVAAVSSTG